MIAAPIASLVVAQGPSAPFVRVVQHGDVFFGHLHVVKKHAVLILCDNSTVRVVKGARITVTGGDCPAAASPPAPNAEMTPPEPQPPPPPMPTPTPTPTPPKGNAS